MYVANKLTKDNVYNHGGILRVIDRDKNQVRDLMPNQIGWANNIVQTAPECRRGHNPDYPTLLEIWTEVEKLYKGR